MAASARAGVERDERVGLQLGERDVLGVERVGPSQLVGDLPGDGLQYSVTQQSDPQSTHVVEVPLRVLLGELATTGGLVEQRQHLGTQQGWTNQLDPSPDSHVVACKVEGDLGSDHVPSHSGNLVMSTCVVRRPT